MKSKQWQCACSVHDNYIIIDIEYGELSNGWLMGEVH